VDHGPGWEVIVIVDPDGHARVSAVYTGPVTNAKRLEIERGPVARALAELFPGSRRGRPARIIPREVLAWLLSRYRRYKRGSGYDALAAELNDYAWDFFERDVFPNCAKTVLPALVRPARLWSEPGFSWNSSTPEGEIPRWNDSCLVEPIDFRRLISPAMWQEALDFKRSGVDNKRLRPPLVTGDAVRTVLEERKRVTKKSRKRSKLLSP
jgi:hypothetical protein